MVRNYVRKRQHQSWTDEDLRRALRSCQRMSVKAAAAKYGIPRGSFYRYIRNNTSAKKPTGTLPIFNGPSEQELIRYIDKLNDVFFDISQRDLRRLAYDLAERLQLKHSFKPGSAGEDWSLKFQATHTDVKIRSLKGPKVVDESQVSKLFRRLSYLIDRHGIEANDIYNMDEIGMAYSTGGDCGATTRVFPTAPQLDPLLTGRLQLDVVYKTSDDDDGVVAYRKKFATAFCCFNATGSFLPPTFVFLSEYLDVRDELTSAAAPGSVVLFSEGGWTNPEVFIDWLGFFVKHVRSSKDHKVLLLMDNDESHVSLGAYDYATEHGVILLSVPTYSADNLLPLHRGLYGQLATDFDEAVVEFDAAALKSPSAEIKLVGLFGRTFLKACNMQRAVDGFKWSGIWPLRNALVVQMDDAESDASNDYFEPIDSEDEVHLIDALYCNGTAHKSKPKLKRKAKSKFHSKSKVKLKAINTPPPPPPVPVKTVATASRRRSRKSLPRKCRKSALRQEDSVEDSS